MKDFESSIAPALAGTGGHWSQLTDRDLVGLVASGNDEAFTVICQRNKQVLLRRAHRIVGNASDAEDVVQEALLSAYRNIANFRFVSSLSTWLNQIVINCALMELRRRRCRKCLSLDDPSQNGSPFTELVRDPATDVEQELLLREQSQLLTSGIAQLPPKLRTIVEAYRMSGPTLAELAKSHAITVAAVKSRLTRAKSMIKNSGPIVNATRPQQRSVAAGQT
jgi:RNA polymerase sigma-70 factor (ECF subfamily)